jgi:hypothetical protein
MEVVSASLFFLQNSKTLLKKGKERVRGNTAREKSSRLCQVAWKPVLVCLEILGQSTLVA